MPINVDPIPEDITQGFGLLRLHDVSVSFAFSLVENGGVGVALVERKYSMIFHLPLSYKPMANSIEIEVTNGFL